MAQANTDNSTHSPIDSRRGFLALAASAAISRLQAFGLSGLVGWLLVLALVSQWFLVGQK